MAYEPILPPPPYRVTSPGRPPLSSGSPAVGWPSTTITEDVKGHGGWCMTSRGRQGWRQVGAFLCFANLAVGRVGRQACGTPTQGDGDHLSLNVEHMTIQVQNRLDRR